MGRKQPSEIPAGVKRPRPTPPPPPPLHVLMQGKRLTTHSHDVILLSVVVAAFFGFLTLAFMAFSRALSLG